MQENIRRKSQNTIFTTWSRLLRLHRLCHCEHCQQFSVFSVVVSPGALPLSYESALVWPQASVQTSIEGRQRLKVKNQSFQPFDLFIRNWFHTLLLVAKILQKSTCIDSHNLHISFTFSPGFVESAVWPHQEFRDRDGKKGSCFT